MTKDEIIESTVYRIRKVGRNAYQIDKLIAGVVAEQYNLEIKQMILDTLDLWCDCPGFRIQKFPKIQHKHIKIALDYRNKGEPAWAEYRMTGAGAKAVIRFVGGSADGR